MQAHVFPLEIVLDKPVTQASGDYKFVVVDGFHQLVRKRTDEPDENANWKIIHKFKILSQVLEDFNGACDFFHRPGSDDVLPHVPVVLAKVRKRGGGTITAVSL